MIRLVDGDFKRIVQRQMMVSSKETQSVYLMTQNSGTRQRSNNPNSLNVDNLNKRRIQIITPLLTGGGSKRIDQASMMALNREIWKIYSTKQRNGKDVNTKRRHKNNQSQPFGRISSLIRISTTSMILLMDGNSNVTVHTSTMDSEKEICHVSLMKHPSGIL